MEMNTVKYALRYAAQKELAQKKVKVEISLDDDLHNGGFDWSITGEEQEKLNGQWSMIRSGACGEELIREYFPELKPFVGLHLRGWNGMDNVWSDIAYRIEQGEWDNGKYKAAYNLTMLNDAELSELTACGDTEYIKYKLFELGVVKAWENQAKKAVELLEELTGKKFENPYGPETDRYTFTLSDAERDFVRIRINEGYYSPEAIAARKAAEVKEALDKEAEYVKQRAAYKIKETTDDMNIKLFVLSAGVSVENMIYYSHTNEVAFNWRSYGKRITPDDLKKLEDPSLDRSKLPEGVKFEIENNSKY